MVILNILILTRISHNSAPYEEWLKCIESNLFMFCDKHKFESFAEVEGYCLKQPIENWRNNGTIELKAYEIFETNPFDKVIALSESDIVRAASIREYLNIPGQSLESAIAFRNKIIMKDILKAARIRVPVYREVEFPQDFWEFAKEIGFPCVIKPIDGAGSSQTYIVNSAAELTSLLGKISHTGKWDMEQYIEGTMYHIDGFIKNSDIKFIWPSRYINGCLAFQKGDFIGSVILSPENELVEPLCNFVKDVLNALPTPEETNFHAEVFVTPNNELVFCEIASRTGGARILDTIIKQFSINLLECWVKEMCGVRYDFSNINFSNKNNYGFILIPPVQGTLEYIPDVCLLPYVVDYKINAEIGENYKAAQRSIDHVASFIIEGLNEKDVKEKIMETVNWFTENCVWDV